MEAQSSRRIAIVGGGFSGSSTAVQLVRRSSAALDITIIEPRERVGGGLAHSSEEPDHRLNGQPRSHNIDPIDEGMFVRWCEAHGAFAADPGARLPNDTYSCAVLYSAHSWRTPSYSMPPRPPVPRYAT